MHSCIVYPIPCSCSQVYIGEIVRRLKKRIKEYKDACKKSAIKKSTVAEHAWTNQHPILWDETTVIDQARRQTELFLKEALHIHLIPEISIKLFILFLNHFREISENTFVVTHIFSLIGTHF